MPSPSSLRQLSQLLLLAAAGFSNAKPYPKDDLHDAGWSFLKIRDCSSYCGSDNQFCCGSDEVCTTLKSDVATCVANGGSYAQWTTTWTETRTYTSTYMTVWDPVPEPTEGVDCVPKNDQQEACGAICCAGWQTCAYDGQCSAKPGVGEGTTVVITSNGKVTTQYSAPYRVTGTTTVVTEGVATNSATASEGATETGTAASSTATSDSDTIGAGGGTGGDLSPGAIAGIVIGTLAGVALLLLLCFCCIARGLWNAIFGKKKEKRERVDVYEERYSRHGSRPPSTAHTGREKHKGWFGGGGPSSVADRHSEKTKKSSGNKWLGIGAGAATLLALLNIKKDKRPPPSSRKARSSRYTDSYYSYSDYTSPSKYKDPRSPIFENAPGPGKR